MRARSRSALFAMGCLLSLRLRQPLIFRLAVEILGPDTPRGRDVNAAWRYPGFRRAFRIITVVWGVSYLVEAAVRVAIVETTSTGIALICSKLLPYVFVLSLSAWTLVYGEHEKQKAERGATASPSAPGPRPRPRRTSHDHWSIARRARSLSPVAWADTPYTLIRCLAR